MLLILFMYNLITNVFSITKLRHKISALASIVIDITGEDVKKLNAEKYSATIWDKVYWYSNFN